MNSRSSSASDWYAVSLAVSGTNSATTVLSELTAIGSYRRHLSLAHATATSKVSSLLR